MRPNTLEDVWKFVLKRGSRECWPWKGYITPAGYGKFRLRGKYIPAHRAVYMAVHGSIPDELDALHKCNRKDCCNPIHIISGNDSDNQIHYSLTDGAPSKSNTGIKGVSYNSARNQYQVTVDSGKSFLYRGPSLEEAVQARRDWEEEQRSKLRSQEFIL
jgi:HNH endonuclease